MTSKLSDELIYNLRNAVDNNDRSAELEHERAYAKIRAQHNGVPYKEISIDDVDKMYKNWD